MRVFICIGGAVAILLAMLAWLELDPRVADRSSSAMRRTSRRAVGSGSARPHGNTKIREESDRSAAPEGASSAEPAGLPPIEALLSLAHSTPGVAMVDGVQVRSADRPGAGHLAMLVIAPTGG